MEATRHPGSPPPLPDAYGDQYRKLFFEPATPAKDDARRTRSGRSASLDGDKPASAQALLSPAVPEIALEDLTTIAHVGRYALKYRIGEGNDGAVFAAVDPLLTRLVAVKTLNFDRSEALDRGFDSFFLDEVRAAADLIHPYIVTWYDAGIGEQGPFIAMELLKGRDLHHLLQEGWRPTPDQVAIIMRRVCDAVGYAHAKGMLHRDLRPASIFMVARTQPRVLDFGIARILQRLRGAAARGAGRAAERAPHYLPPEQWNDEPLDRRSDVFSLGVVMYELLTGAKPFQGSTVAEVIDSILRKEPVPAHRVDASVPRELSAIVARALKKDPVLRYASAREMSRELQAWLDANGQANETIEPEPEPGKRWWRVGAGVLVVGALALWLLPPRSTPSSTAKAPAAAPPAASQPTVVASAAVPALPASEAALAVATPALGLPAAEDVEAAAAAASAADVIAEAASAAEHVPARVVPAASAAKRPAAAPPPAPASAAKPVEHKLSPPKPVVSETPVAPPVVAAATTGIVHIAVSPWGNIEVDGKPAGVAPPLTQLSLPAGEHTITIRNEDYPPRSVTVTVVGGQSVSVKQRF